MGRNGKSGIEGRAELAQVLYLPQAAPVVRIAKNNLHCVLLYRFGNVGKRRSEEHTSELQSHLNLVCRLLLEKKKIASRSSAGRSSSPPYCSCSPSRRSSHR